MASQAVKEKPKKQTFLSSRGERASYGLYFVGQNIFYVFIYMYLSTFFTDIGIPALTVAGIALVVKVWDAINDPIFGGFVDKFNFKKGKFVPWLRISLIFIPLCTVFLFAIPSSLPLTVKVGWAVVGYLLWDMAYTVCDVPIFGLVTTMTDRQQERTVLMTIGRVAAQVAVLGVMVAVPMARKAIGGWLPTIIVLSIVAFLTMLPICFSAKERIKPVVNAQEVGIKEMFTFVAKNKYLIIFYGSLLIYYSTNIAGTVSMYFARHCLGNEAMAGILSIATMIPGIVVGLFIPSLCKRIDKFDIYFFSIAISAGMGIVQFFIGYSNLPVFLVFAFLRGIPFGIVSMTMFMFTPDCAEYGHFKTGISAPGIAFSLQTFSIKLMTAISTAFGALVLSIIGFVEGEGAAQLPGFESKLWIIYMLVPAIGALLSLPFLRMYKLRDKTVEIMAKCNAGEITHEEADKLLDGKI